MNTLPVNDQRPTRNAQRATSELPNSSFLTPNSSFRRHSLRSGMTMIELVAALALFVVIFGVLLIALNTATNLWRNSRAQRRELPSAEHIADLIADDLYQSVADISDTNSLYRSFYLYAPTNIPPDTVTFHLAFLRPASPRTLIPPGLSSGTRTSLDAVFYTSYANALFRHVVPVVHADYSAAFTNGIALPHDFITDVQDLLNDPNLHRALLYPLGHAPAAVTTSSTLLAERIIISNFGGFYSDAPEIPHDDITSDLLPDYLATSFHLFSPDDWNIYQILLQQSLPKDEFEFRASTLGTRISKCITLPQKGGTRLP